MDSVDVVEELARIYNEDYWDKRDAAQKKHIVDIARQSKEMIERLYPLFYADKFEYSATEFSDSKSGNAESAGKRRELIEAALRFNVAAAKKQVPQSIEQLTTF
jgi:hypothetical protein